MIFSELKKEKKRKNKKISNFLKNEGIWIEIEI